MNNFKICAAPRLSNWTIPRDGVYRYICDIWQPLTLLALTSCFTAVFYATYSPLASQNPEDLFFCNADGNVERARPDYKPLWDPQLYFTVNIAFGQFAFSTAKVIDAGWDAVVGRGGQMLAALVAYRTLRRSLTLTMETYAVTLPTVAAICFSQVQLVSLGRLAQDVFWSWSSQHSKRTWPVYLGKMRLSMQIFICIYVLLFATLVSVMTGYRAQLTGYYGYDTTQASQLQPVSELSRPSMVVLDGGRIGLSESPMYALEKIPFPGGEQKGRETQYAVADLIESSRHFEEPYGVLVDYYFTCSAIVRWAMTRDTNLTLYNLKCARHECSCSVHDVEPLPNLGFYDAPSREYIEEIRGIGPRIFANMTSDITINEKLWELPAPPLTIGLASAAASATIHAPAATFDNAIDYWSKTDNYFNPDVFYFNNQSIINITTYWNGDLPFDEDAIKRTGRCISEDAYSWGFSSLLLLTFCSFTIVFALALILLQTDVYWNSRHDHYGQSYSIYTDVLYLAQELKATFGDDDKEHMQSPKVFAKQVERWKQGLRLKVKELPMSRWQEHRQARAKKTTSRKNRATSGHTDGMAYELRPSGSADQQKPETVAAVDQEVANQPRADSRPGAVDVSEQMSVCKGREVAAPAAGRSTRVSVSEEQGLIANAARNGSWQSIDEAGHEVDTSRQRRAEPTVGNMADHEPNVERQAGDRPGYARYYRSQALGEYGVWFVVEV